MNGLKILLWNSNGILSHKNELEVVLYNYDIDVALLTETHLTSQIKLLIPTYNTFRTDHPSNSAKGGTLILVKKSIIHHLNSSEASESLQCTSVSLKVNPFPFSVAAVYCPPGVNVSSQTFDSCFHNLGNRYLCGGDFNAKNQVWGSRLTNSRGRALHNSMLSNRCSHISPPSPTYWPSDLNRIPDTLDFFICKGLNQLQFDLVSLHDLSSDHSPLLLSVDVKPFPKILQPTLTPSFVNWNGFRETLEKSISLNTILRTPDEVDDAVQLLTQAIQQAAWRCLLIFQKNKLM